jgi:hypothetical protein
MNNRLTIFSTGFLLASILLVCFQRQYLEVTLTEIKRNRDSINEQVSNLNEKIDAWQCQKLVKKKHD